VLTLAHPEGEKVVSRGLRTKIEKKKTHLENQFPDDTFNIRLDPYNNYRMGDII
jgi:hypothetical protein